MLGRFLSSCFLILVLVPGISAQDWSQWRGPAGVNHAPGGATAPTEWSDEDGLAWVTELPGRGNASPTVVGDNVYLTTGDAEAETQSLLILDRASGKLLKEVVVHEGKLPDNITGKNSHANATVASDGKHVFAMFLNDAAPVLTAFDLEGEKLWQKRVPGEIRINFEWGFGSSPIIVDDLVIVATEFNVEGSGIYAFDTATGEQKWMTPRPKQFSYSTPAMARIDGQLLLLMCGNNSYNAYDAQTGKEVWSREATTMATCGTMAWDPALGLAFGCGGHPDRFTSAVSLSGEHEVVWKHNVKCYEQSVLTVKGFVYAVSDVGVAYCWNATDGEEMWKQRLRGNFSSSPIYVGDNIYVTNETGTTFVFEANPEKFNQLAKNRLGTQAFATPSPADDRLYHRYIKDGKEFLAAIGPELENKKKQNAAPERELSVMVVTGGHEYDKPEFEEMFASLNKVNCEYATTKEMQALDASEIASKYDALVLLDFETEKVADEAKQQYLELSQSGVGMVFLHFTLASRPHWDGYHEMVGGKFFLPHVEKDKSLHSAHTPNTTVEARVLNPGHPVTKDMKDFQITDTFYKNISVASSAMPLLTASHENSSATIAWAHKFKSSRVVYMMPGFTKQAYQCEGYRQFIQNAIRYVGE